MEAALGLRTLRLSLGVLVRAPLGVEARLGARLLRLPLGGPSLALRASWLGVAFLGRRVPEDGGKPLGWRLPILAPVRGLPPAVRPVAVGVLADLPLALLVLPLVVVRRGAPWPALREVLPLVAELAVPVRRGVFALLGGLPELGSVMASVGGFRSRCLRHDRQTTS